ncbi:MAG: helix-turn-helix domain-containing protein [Candidatus Hadarchaeales archaeon]
MKEIRERISRWIAGDIVLSANHGEAIRRWRERFGLTQTALAERVGVSPSVVSDYEANRRKSPGASMVRRIVDMMVAADEEKGGTIIRSLSQLFGPQLPSDVVLDIREFAQPVNGKTICKAVDGEAVANRELLDRKLFGYTAIDGPRAILELSAEDFKRLYGLTTERALVFTGVTTGRSPMVAIKVIGITPGMVILHGELVSLDQLGTRIAEMLRVPLVISRSPSVQALLEALKKCAE